MAVTSRDLHSAGQQRSHAFRSPPVARAYPTYRAASRLPYMITGLLCLVALLLIANGLIGWGQTKVDDLRYGRPRTTKLSSFVNHNEGPGGGLGTPTQFI